MRPRRTLVARLLRSFFWQIRPRSFCARSIHDSAARFAGTASPALLSQQAAPGSASACADARGRGWSGGCVVVRGSRERARHGHHQAMLERSRRLVRPFPDQTQEPRPVAVRRAHVLAPVQVAAAWPAARVRGRPSRVRVEPEGTTGDGRHLGRCGGLCRLGARLCQCRGADL